MLLLENFALEMVKKAKKYWSSLTSKLEFSQEYNFQHDLVTRKIQQRAKDQKKDKKQCFL